MRHPAFLLAAGLALAASPAFAADPEYLVAEAAGTITVAPDGSVADVRIGERDRIGEAASAGLEAQVRTWRFEPVIEAGRAVQAKAYLRVSLVVVQEPGAEQAEMSVRDVWFLDPPERAGGKPVGASDSLKPPAYPYRALQAGAGAEVMLFLELGEDGRVARVGTERVALLGAPQGASTGKLAKLMSTAAERAASDWRIAGYEPGQTVRVPVRFSGSRPGWLRMHPVPIEPVPWIVAAVANDGVADFAAGGQRPASLQLLTELEPVPGLGDGG